MKPSPLTLPAATSAFGMIIALLSLPLLALSFFIPNGFWLFATSVVMAGIGGGFVFLGVLLKCASILFRK